MTPDPRLAALRALLNEDGPYEMRPHSVTIAADKFAYLLDALAAAEGERNRALFAKGVVDGVAVDSIRALQACQNERDDLAARLAGAEAERDRYLDHAKILGASCEKLRDQIDNLDGERKSETRWADKYHTDWLRERDRAHNLTIRLTAAEAVIAAADRLMSPNDLAGLRASINEYWAAAPSEAGGEGRGT